MNSVLKIIRIMKSSIIGRFETEIWIITVARTLTSTGFSICTPFISLYLYQERGISMTVIGLVFLASGLLSAATQFIAGMLIDRFGRRPLFLGATFSSVLLYAGLAVLIGT